MRVNTNVSNKTRRELVLDDFKGVDFSSSPLKVSGSRASFASNLICDNGVNHKRPGWEQVLKLKGKINGMYEFGGALIVYAGTKFYKVEEETATLIDYEEADDFPLMDQKVQFFPHKDRLYIIGPGDYLVYGTWDDGASYELRRVADLDDLYIPTVLTGIEAGGAGGSSLEGVNVFTKRRKVCLVGAEEDLTWQIPDVISQEYPIVITVEFPGRVLIGTVDTDTNKADMMEGTDRIGEACFVTKYEIENFGENGEILNSTYYYAGDLTFSFSTKPIGNAYSNITVEYTSANEYVYETESVPKSTMLRKMRFGTTFGAYGNSDRLFLSGNPDMPNADFYSGFDDFTYFTAESQTVMGSKDQAITGYIRLSDSTLATLKAPSVTEPTVYYRTATELDDEGATKVAFTRWTGGIGEGCVSSYCIATLAGDDLMLSENGLFGIVQVQNSATNDRYFRERDRFINSDLIKRDLSKATAIVYNNRYYLAVDGVCYVADPRYKTYVKDDIDGSFNYEWWYWENIPASVFAIVNGELWFGTEEGMICRFDDKFTDRTYDETVAGQLSADGSTLTHEKNMDVEVCDGDEIELDGYDGRLYVTGYNASECTFRVSKEKDGDPISNIGEELGIGTSVNPLIMKVWYYKNVVSKWFSPVFDLGAFDVSKTLLSMSITVDPTVRGKVQFGYDTRDCEKTILRNSLGEGYFDYDAINFSDFSFEANFAASHTVRVKDRNFNYITFKLISDNDKDCAVCNLKAVYQYNGRLKGVH